MLTVLDRLDKNIEELYIINDRKGKEFLLSPVIYLINYW